MLGIGMRVAAAAGALLLVLMWTAVPPGEHPFMDDHLIYAAVLVAPHSWVLSAPSDSAAPGPPLRWFRRFPWLS